MRRLTAALLALIVDRFFTRYDGWAGATASLDSSSPLVRAAFSHDALRR